jgi:hypothetical protein
MLTVRSFISQKLRNSKVEKLDVTVVTDHDIGRLEVAMNDQVAMRIFDRAADVHEKTESFLDWRAPLVAVNGERHAGYILHREVRTAVFADASVEKAGNVGMFETREDLSLPTEAHEDFIGVHPAFHELQRNPLIELPVGALGQPYRAHPASSNLFQQTVATDNRASRLRGISSVVGVHHVRRGEDGG